MPKLIQLYIRQVLLGFVISAGFVALLLYANVANLWHLVSSSDAGLLAVFLLWLFNGIVFAGVQFGIAIMRLEDNGPGAGGPRVHHGFGKSMQLQPIPVREDSRDRRRRF